MRGGKGEHFFSVVEECLVTNKALAKLSQYHFSFRRNFDAVRRSCCAVFYFYSDIQQLW